MDRIRSMDLHPEMFVRRVNLSHILVAVVKTALALLIVGSIGFGAAVRAGIAPEFDKQLTLDAQHILVIHNGPSPTCTSIPNPPQHDCFWPGPERRAFSVDYLTPHGVRSLLWFRLPAR
ncbi:MAG TPA: hypothetical protein VFU22_34105 [Roseiflexaceae bacterium]|nr:hypothetical protein [Roseiflexaceae bacterium]